MRKTAFVLIACVPLFSCGDDRRARTGPSDAGPPKSPSASTIGTESRAGIRLAVLSPAAASMIRDMGAGGTIVARHGWDAWTDRNLPPAGDQNGIDIEALLGTRPTHVIVELGAAGIPEALNVVAHREGWTVTNVRTLTVADIRAAAVLLGETLGEAAPGSGAFLERMEVSLRARAVDREEDRPRVLLLESVSPPAALGPGSSHGEVLRLVGGRAAVMSKEAEARENKDKHKTDAQTEGLKEGEGREMEAVGEAGGAAYVRLDLEGLRAIEPDAVVVLAPARPGEARSEWTRERIVAYLGDVAVLGIKAIDEGRVWVADDPEVLLAGASTVRFAEELRAKVEEWREARARASQSDSRDGASRANEEQDQERGG